MPKRTEKLRHSSVRIVIKSPDEAIYIPEHNISYCLMPPDHLAVLDDKDAHDFAPTFLDGVWWRKCEQHDLEIVCPVRTRIDIKGILLAAKEHSCDYNQITLLFGKLDRETLDFLLAHWESVTLIACAFEHGWWEPERSRRKCDCLQLFECSIIEPPENVIGSASWTGLEGLMIHDGHCDRRLTSETRYVPDRLPRVGETYKSDPRALLHAFWGASIQDLTISDWEGSPRLQDLGRAIHLAGADVSGTPLSLADFRWLTGCRAISSLALSWLPGTALPWMELDKLPNLEYLNLSRSQCTDQDLDRILEHTRLSTIHLYHSRVTNASLPKLLASDSMRMVWASSEMFSGEIPTELPVTTNVRELVAFNCNLEYPRKIAERYPGMIVSEM